MTARSRQPVRFETWSPQVKAVVSQQQTIVIVGIPVGDVLPLSPTATLTWQFCQFGDIHWQVSRVGDSWLGICEKDGHLVQHKEPRGKLPVGRRMYVAAAFDVPRGFAAVYLGVELRETSLGDRQERKAQFGLVPDWQLADKHRIDKRLDAAAARPDCEIAVWKLALTPDELKQHVSAIANDRGQLKYKVASA